MNATAADVLHADVTRAARGDREAFARLVTATSGLVTAITAVEARDLEASRDAAQEAYLDAWRDLSTLRNPQSFLPWLRELARRRAREARDRAGPLVTGAPAEEALAAAEDAAPGAAFTAAVLAAIGTAAPMAAGAATASGLAAKAGAGALAGSVAVVGGAGALAALAMGGEARLLLAQAEGEVERDAVRRYGRLSQGSIALFAVGLPVLATVLKIRWLYAASFGAYALSLVVLQRTMVPRAVLERLARQRGAPTALRLGQGLGLVGGVACLALAAWWSTR